MLRVANIMIIVLITQFRKTSMLSSVQSYLLSSSLNSQEDVPKDAYTTLKERLQAKKDGPAPKEVVEGQMYNDKVRVTYMLIIF